MGTKPAPDDEMLAGKGQVVEFRLAEAGDEKSAPDRSHLAPTLVSRCAADIVPEAVQWLWPGRVAVGKHTTIAGEPGTGKSQLTIDIIARITTGGDWPCGEGKAPLGNVIIFSAEDGDADTIVPRLMAAGADLSRAHIVTAVQDGHANRSLNLSADLALVEAEIERIGGVVLVVIDPISSYLGRVDSHRNTEVRGVLEPLSEMAGRHGVGVLSVTHLTKGSAERGRPIDSFIGSIAFIGAPRAAFIVVDDAENDRRRLLLPVKNNIAERPAGLAFRLQSHAIGDIVTSRLSWEADPVLITADEAMAAMSPTSRQTSGKEKAMVLLREALSSGPMAKNDLEALAKTRGISPRSLRDAREALGVIHEREGFGPGGVSMWKLPEAA